MEAFKSEFFQMVDFKSKLSIGNFKPITRTNSKVDKANGKSNGRTNGKTIKLTVGQTANGKANSRTNTWRLIKLEVELEDFEQEREMVTPRSGESGALVAVESKSKVNRALKALVSSKSKYRISWRME